MRSWDVMWTNCPLDESFLTKCPESWLSSPPLPPPPTPPAPPPFAPSPSSPLPPHSHPHYNPIHHHPKVGSPQISSASRKYSKLRTYISLNFQTFRKCGNLWICGLRTICFFVICGFAIYIFSALKTSTNPKFIIFLLTNISFPSNFRTTFGFGKINFFYNIFHFPFEFYGNSKRTMEKNPSISAKANRREEFWT